MMKRKQPKTTLVPSNVAVKRDTSVPVREQITKAEPIVIINSYPGEIQDVNPVPVESNTAPFIQTNKSYFEYLNADYNANFREASFFVPVQNKEKTNLLTGSEEPYGKIIQETFEDKINSSMGNVSVYNISHAIGNKAENYFTDILHTNMNIILYNGLVSLILEYAVCDTGMIYNLYTKNVFDEFGSSAITGMKREFMSLIVDEDHNLMQYQQNKNELQKIMEVGTSVRYKVASQIASLLYRFINNVVFGGYIDIVKLNYDIINDFQERNEEYSASIPTKEIEGAAASLVTQHLLEVANIDMYKIIEITDITYMTVVNSILHDIYLTKMSNMVAINPFNDKSGGYTDGYKNW